MHRAMQFGVINTMCCNNQYWINAQGWVDSGYIYYVLNESKLDKYTGLGSLKKT